MCHLNNSLTIKTIKYLATTTVLQKLLNNEIDVKMKLLRGHSKSTSLAKWRFLDSPLPCNTGIFFSNPLPPTN